ncbi:hypothetical protein KDL44_07195 [bacterium]|nr:hypothetical protein [bacterium]
MRNSWKNGTVLLLAAWLLAACGGGGGSEIFIADNGSGNGNGGGSSLLPFSRPPAESFSDNSPASDDAATSWVKDAYLSLPDSSDADAAYQNLSLAGWADEVLRLTNVERERYGLPPLERSRHLDYVAQAHARDMGLRDYFSHTSQGYGLSPFDRMNAVQTAYYDTAGENVAAGQRTPQEVLIAWMGSSGHRANILNPSFTHIGIGVYYDSAGGLHTEQWVQLFAGFRGDPEDASWIVP